MIQHQCKRVHPVDENSDERRQDAREPEKINIPHHLSLIPMDKIIHHIITCSSSITDTYWQDNSSHYHLLVIYQWNLLTIWQINSLSIEINQIPITLW